MTHMLLRRALGATLMSGALAAVAYAQSTEAERLKAQPTMSPSAATRIAPEAAAQAKGDQDNATASILDRSGRRVGLVTLTTTPTGTLINGEFTGLPAGVHGFHIHAVGKCEPPFDSAGPHFNPSSTQHGIAVGQGHAGDLPNLFVPDSGRVHVEFFAPEVNIRNGDRSVFDADGAALVVHAKRDDYKTDPAGDAGERIACGVIER
jgi:superoxide dismutase, Cu-Zn family